MSFVLQIIDPELPATSNENLSDHNPESILTWALLLAKNIFFLNDHIKGSVEFDECRNMLASSSTALKIVLKNID